MRAWPTPPHGRRHKAPPPPFALTTNPSPPPTRRKPIRRPPELIKTQLQPNGVEIGKILHGTGARWRVWTRTRKPTKRPLLPLSAPLKTPRILGVNSRLGWLALEARFGISPMVIDTRTSAQAAPFLLVMKGYEGHRRDL